MFDSSDPTNSIKFKYTYSDLIRISSTGYSIHDFSLTENEYVINDWYSFFYKEGPKSFYSMEREESFYEIHAFNGNLFL